jgi:hypothetical protein
MMCNRTALLGVGFCLVATHFACKRDSTMNKEVNVTKTRVVEIVPGRSIGEVKVGMKVESLPARAKLQRPSGTLDGIQFLVSDAGQVDDVWIEDLHVFPDEVQCLGKVIPRDATIEGLGEVVGKCDRIPGLKGGIFYTCAAGLGLGTDFSRSTLQIRVKPISTGSE